MVNYKDYPPIPESIETDILHTISNYAHTYDPVNHVATDAETANKFNSQRPVFTETTLGVPFEQASIHYPDTALFAFIDPPASLQQWVNDNIGPYPVNVQIMSKGTYVMPHVDEIRQLALNYLITTGNASTCIYAPKEEYKNYTVGPQMVFPKDRIIKVQEEVIDVHRWHTLDVTSIHGVEHINSTRISVTVSLMDQTLL